MAFPVFATLARGDTFNRANEDPVDGKKWRTFGGAGLAGPLIIVGNVAFAESDTFCGSYLDYYEYTACEIMATLAPQDVNRSKHLKLRLTPSVPGTNPIPDPAQNGYELTLDDSASDTWEIKRIDAGSGTSLGTIGGTALATGEKMGFQAIGSGLVGYKVTAAGVATPVISVVDGTYKFGKAGIVVGGNLPGFDDVWVGGLLYGSIEASYAELPKPFVPSVLP